MSVVRSGEGRGAPGAGEPGGRGSGSISEQVIIFIGAGQGRVELQSVSYDTTISELAALSRHLQLHLHIQRVDINEAIACCLLHYISCLHVVGLL